MDGIEAFYQPCVANGVTIIKPLAATAWGTKDFYIDDPDGYIMQLTAAVSNLGGLGSLGDSSGRIFRSRRPGRRGKPMVIGACPSKSDIEALMTTFNEFEVRRWI